jgi:hypothetical protein
MAILSGREKPLANDGRAGHLRGANSAADTAATTRLRPIVPETTAWQAATAHSCIVSRLR